MGIVVLWFPGREFASGAAECEPAGESRSACRQCLWPRARQRSQRSVRHSSVPEFAFTRPGGTFENSPAIHCWDRSSRDII